MILGILPETCDVEIIFPTNDVNSLAEITKPASTILLIVVSIWQNSYRGFQWFLEDCPMQDLANRFAGKVAISISLHL